MKILFPALALCLLSACSLFSPRDAQSPTQPLPSGFTSYDDIMDRLVDIYSYGPASDLYLILSDGFIFEGDSLDSAALSSARRAWDATLEKLITKNMLSDTLRRVARHNSGGIEVITNLADSAVVRWDYLLALRDSSRIEGTSWFTLVRTDNRFYLSYWKDRLNPSTSGAKSWGRWKMENN